VTSQVCSHSRGAGRLLRATAPFLALVAFAMCGGQKSSASQSPAPTPSPTPVPSGSWRLSWSDEFNGADGSRPDESLWAYDLGGKGWGNQELETYTDRAENASIQGGSLVITARSERYTGTDGTPRDYTSARLKTQGHFSQAYGRVEARIQIPRGQGMWPAFWMLGNDVSGVGWPACGEIDIMENIGKEPTIVHGSLHGPGYSGGNPLSQSYTLPNGQKFADGFHVFAVEWELSVVRFYVDDTLYGTKTPADAPAGAHWAYDHPFYLLLNVAVGGTWPGAPDSTTVFPQTMMVDYVRVYSR
jgi:beta-glucanase (GH16 family)